MISKIVLSMALLRFISGSAELIAAVLMLKFNNIERAILINSGLALVGPSILIATTAIGLSGIADKLSTGRLIMIFGGITLLLVGIIKK